MPGFTVDVQTFYHDFTPVAHSGCLMDDAGLDYRDAAMFTESGYSCQAWQDMMDQPINPITYPDAGKLKTF